MDVTQTIPPLHYREAGRRDAPPLLLLHGITGSSRYWDRAVRHFEDRWRILTPDLLGFGESPKPDLDYSVEVYVRSLERFIDDRGLAGNPLCVVGHSLGAIVALEYLRRHRGAFERLVLMSLPRHASREEAHRLFLANSVNYRRILGVNDLQACVRSARDVGPGVFFQYLTRFPYQVVRDSSKFTLRSLLTTLENCLMDYRLDEVLEHLEPLPVLLIHGDRDMVAPVENVKHLGRRRNWRLRIIEGTGHHVFLTHTRECLEAIEEHLDADASGSRGPGASLE